MKTVNKILAILVIAMCTLVIMPKNVSMAATSTTKDIVGGVKAEAPDDDYSEGLQTTIGKLLGFLQVASGLVAIIMIALVGFNYIVSTPEVKKEIQTKLLPIIVGLVLVFGAVSLAKFILGVVGG